MYLLSRQRQSKCLLFDGPEHKSSWTLICQPSIGESLVSDISLSLFFFKIFLMTSFSLSGLVAAIKKSLLPLLGLTSNAIGFIPSVRWLLGIIGYYSHYRHKFGSTFFHFSFFADTNPKRGFAAYKSIF